MTFGAPMVTDAAGAAILRDLVPVMRVTHERDPVPLTPLESGSRTSAVAAKLLSKSLGQDRRPQTAREQAEEGAVVVVVEEEREGQGNDDEEEVRSQEAGGRGASGSEGRDESDGGGGRDSPGVSSGGGEEAGTGDGVGHRGRRVASSPVYSHFGSQVGGWMGNDGTTM